MTDRIPAGAVTDAAGLVLEHEPVPAGQVVAGAPTTALHELDETTGVWEMSPGAMSDVRLRAGMHTVWTVRETLRKVYVAL